jgi:hypothetical protein
MHNVSKRKEKTAYPKNVKVQSLKKPGYKKKRYVLSGHRFVSVAEKQRGYWATDKHCKVIRQA